jgi:hypothetical protein
MIGVDVVGLGFAKKNDSRCEKPTKAYGWSWLQGEIQTCVLIFSHAYAFGLGQLGRTSRALFRSYIARAVVLHVCAFAGTSQ